MSYLRKDDTVQVKQILGMYTIDSEIAQTIGKKGIIIKVQHPAYRVMFDDGRAFTYFQEEIEKC